MAIRTDRKRGGLPIDLGVAALAAAALGFLAFAMPGALFEGLVASTGLPDYVAAARPPLGTTARGAAIAAAALAGFAAVLILLRALDRIPARARAKAVEPADGEAPRLRRADAHPDAPARRPLLAGRELSEPVEDDGLEPLPELFADPPALPGFLAGEAEPAPAEELAEAEAEAAEPGDVEEEEYILDRRFDEEDFADDGEEARDEESIDERAFASLVSQLPDGPDDVGNESITDLMRRLESGLSRRELAGEDEAFDAPAGDEIAEAPATPSWLAPQPEAVEAAELDIAAEEESADISPASEAPSWLAPRTVADPAPATAPASAPPQPRVNEFGELSWPQQRPQNDAFATPRPAFVEPEQAPVEQVHAPAPAPVDAPAQYEPAPETGESRVGHRLRTAIDQMQKIAARGG